MNAVTTRSSGEPRVTADSLLTANPSEPERQPASPAQASLWFIQQLHPTTPAFNIPEGWRLRGPLHHAGLQWALGELVRRHETLRTSFENQDGEPIQVIHSAMATCLPIVDLSECPHERQKAELERLVQAEAQRPFDLHQAPLWRAVLFRLSPEDHFFMVNPHHAIADAWSIQVLVKDLNQIYAAWVAGWPPQLPELKIQFADYVAWARSVSTGGYHSDQEAYWRQVLSEKPAAMELPADWPRSAQRTYQGATQFARVPGELIERLRTLAKAQQTTLFTVMLAGFKVLLHRLTRETDIIVGSPFAGRARAEVEPIIGFLADTFPLRTDCGGNPRYLELLRRVRETVLDATANSDVTPQYLAGAVQGGRDGERHPLYQVVFGLQPAIRETLNLHGVRSEHLPLDNGGSKFDWTLLLTETPDGLEVRSEFDTSRFKPETVQRWLDCYLVLLDAIAEDPGRTIPEYPLITPVQREILLTRGVGPITAYERHSGIYEVFASIAAAHAEKPAIRFGAETLSYKELDERSSRLASVLIHYQVGKGSLVGVCLPRGPEFVISLLGIMKAGAAYVPLDPEYPKERLRWMLKDTDAALVIADAVTAAAVHGCGATILDIGLVDLLRGDSDFLPQPAAAEDPAYVIYTSGSTGTPKGAVVPHRAVVRLVRNTHYASFGPSEVFLQLAPVSFDASTFEIWGALLNGALLVIAPPGLLSLEQMGRVLRDHQITTLWLTAGLFHQMTDNQLESMHGLRQLLAGGDVLSPAHVVKARKALPGCRIINGYGPTENTTFTCCYTVPHDWQGDRSVPIGKPIANTQVYILNEAFEPAPIGVPGELFIGGDGLARGYLNAEDATNEKFVMARLRPDSQPVRLYRTGDLVRWLPGGSIEFLGRLDHQIKIRGFRIEPGEIEAALCTHPAVQSAVVAAPLDVQGSRSLAAYYVLRAGSLILAENLREHLAARLPAHLVPHHFIRLPELPLNANGKVDRAALPEPSLLMPAQQGEPPRPGTETELARIWSEVLRVSSPSREDDFFAMGGHSLLATQVISRVVRVFGVELPVRAVFEAPTLASLAAVIDCMEQDGQNCSIRPTGRNARATDLLARLSELSESEVDALLQDAELKGF